jgi:hypothetical protein
MKNTVLNETMNLTIPEGFTEITQEEVQAMTMCKGPAPMWNIINREEHTLITASWFKAGWILSHLFSAKDMAKSILNNYKSGMKEKSRFGGTYSDIRETTLDGNKAYTYSCSYRAFTKGMTLAEEPAMRPGRASLPMLMKPLYRPFNTPSVSFQRSVSVDGSTPTETSLFAIEVR